MNFYSWLNLLSFTGFNPDSIAASREAVPQNASTGAPNRLSERTGRGNFERKRRALE
jgi:hypothetical protein